MNCSLGKLAFEGDYGGIVQCLENDPSLIQETDDFGHSALFSAVIGKQLKICSYLIVKGCDVNERSLEFGFTLLHKACLAGSLDICKLLVENGADVRAHDHKESDAMYNAITGAGDLEMCRYLTIKGASIVGMLHLSCFSGKLEIVRWLIEEHNQDVNSKGYRDNTPLHLASQQGHFSICKLLIQHHADVKARNEAGCTPLHEAMLAPRCERITAYLVLSGADINAKDNEDRAPLHKAAQMGHIEHCQVLLDIGADINILDQSKYYHNHNNNGNNNNTNLNNNLSPLKGAIGIGDTALHYAIVSGSTEMCVFLLDHGINIHIKSAQGQPIVYFACQHKKYKICSLLIDRGAFVDELNYKQVQIPINLTNISNKITKNPTINTTTNSSTSSSSYISLTYSETALHKAAQTGNTEACMLLLSKGADVNATDEIFGNTALYLAAREGYFDICHLLLQYMKSKEDINKRNKYFDNENILNKEETVLHIAVQYEHWDICVLFIEYHANPQLLNRLNQDCFELATNRNFKNALVQLWQCSSSGGNSSSKMTAGRSGKGEFSMESGKGESPVRSGKGESIGSSASPWLIRSFTGVRERASVQSTYGSSSVSSNNSPAYIVSNSSVSSSAASTPVRPTVLCSNHNHSSSSGSSSSSSSMSIPITSETQLLSGSPPPTPIATTTVAVAVAAEQLPSQTETSTTIVPVPPLPPLPIQLPPYYGPERIWKDRKVRFSCRKTLFKQTIWQTETLELNSRPQKGAWINIIAYSTLIYTIPLENCLPVEIQTIPTITKVSELRLLFNKPNNKHSFLKLSFGNNKKKLKAWKNAIIQHINNGK